MTFNTHERRALLANISVQGALIHYAERGYREHGAATGRYVLMPDHIHLFVCLSESGYSLVRWVGGLKRALGCAVRGKSCDNAEVWQTGFFDHVLCNHENYSEKWEYVRLNPVRAGLCAHPEEWPWQGEVVPLRY